MQKTNDIVQKLWNLCSLLREDGVTYHQYVTELTYILFLKMLKETKGEEALPNGLRWDDLVVLKGKAQLDFYKRLLFKLGTLGSARVRDIYVGASSTLRQPKTLAELVRHIDGLHWHSETREHIGDLYEGLLEKNATEVKSGAGQYFTPRPLVESMVALVKPHAGELVQDPAAGTGGFLIAADRHVKSQTDNLRKLPEKLRRFQRTSAFHGMELVPDTHKLALMNMMLHQIKGNLLLGDTLSPQGAMLAPADVILTNPPFGTKKGGGRPTRNDLTFPTSNKQLAFVEHIYRGLKPGGRAAVVVPDNVLFEENVGTAIRADLMDKCNLHTILRLPTGIFYAQGIKTNVLFFNQGTTTKNNTKAIWFYDMRANMPSFGKRTQLTRDHFLDFERSFGTDPLGKSKRIDQGQNGRFRKFTREHIQDRGDNLDISWLRENTQDRASNDADDPTNIANQIRNQLKTAISELDALTALLEGLETVS
ncbi:N-6 DNA methylase [Corallococcus exiguus]|uniref:class I SAM-dependent DNA methyltransferase n=1 Tax=Corallococcus exiguus TaxID=83462 RepID=UPI00155FD054|nr:N-6 DNA methylase [Corallococcus exiguus]NRD55710.1 N-6 DNA methylase [Corallococcus exiguus]